MKKVWNRKRTSSALDFQKQNALSKFLIPEVNELKKMGSILIGRKITSSKRGRGERGRILKAKKKNKISRTIGAWYEKGEIYFFSLRKSASMGGVGYCKLEKQQQQLISTILIGRWNTKGFFLGRGKSNFE